MNAFVLDACALVAYIEGESGADKVEEVLQSGFPVHMAAINLLEVCYDAERRQSSPNAARVIITTALELGIRIEWNLTESWLLAARIDLDSFGS